jgi:uncharacterized protein (DUF58 family)
VTERQIVAPLGVGVHELQQVAQAMGGRLTLRGIVEGNLSGSHRSPRQGVSLDFAQHRDYVPGDDLRHLDWRAYAKSDRYVVRQYEEETNLRAYMVLDRSMSMNYRGGAPVEKGIFGSRLAAALSWTLLQQGEAVGLVMFGGELDHYLPARSQRDHFWRMLRDLEDRPWQEETRIPEALLGLPGRLPPRGVVFLITDGFDFYDDETQAESRLVEVARALRKQSYYVIVLHVLDPHELDFPFDELALFEGLEGEDPLKIDPESVRKAYLEELSAFRMQIESECRAVGATYCLCPSDRSLELTLLELLEQVS